MRIARGEVYRYVEDGEVRYASARPAPRAGLGQVSRQSYTYMESCFACALQADVDFATIRLNTEAYRQETADELALAPCTVTLGRTILRVETSALNAAIRLVAASDDVDDRS